MQNNYIFTKIFKSVSTRYQLWYVGREPNSKRVAFVELLACIMCLFSILIIFLGIIYSLIFITSGSINDILFNFALPLLLEEPNDVGGFVFIFTSNMFFYYLYCVTTLIFFTYSGLKTNSKKGKSDLVVNLFLSVFVIFSIFSVIIPLILNWHFIHSPLYLEKLVALIEVVSIYYFYRSHLFNIFMERFIFGKMRDVSAIISGKFFNWWEVDFIFLMFFILALIAFITSTFIVY